MPKSPSLSEILSEIKRGNKRHDKIEKRFDKLEKRFDKIDKRLSGIEKELKNIDGRLSTIEKNIENILEAVSAENAAQYPSIKRHTSDGTSKMPIAAKES